MRKNFILILKLEKLYDILPLVIKKEKQMGIFNFMKSKEEREESKKANEEAMRAMEEFSASLKKLRDRHEFLTGSNAPIDESLIYGTRVLDNIMQNSTLINLAKLKIRDDANHFFTLSPEHFGDIGTAVELMECADESFKKSLGKMSKTEKNKAIAEFETKVLVYGKEHLKIRQAELKTKEDAEVDKEVEKYYAERGNTLREFGKLNIPTAEEVERDRSKKSDGEGK